MRYLIFLSLLLTTGCVNITDHYGVTVCNNSSCDYKDYDGKKSVILETKYDYDYNRMLGLAVSKATESCLVGYAIIDDYFPSDAEVFKFHWDKDIKADYILYMRLESQSKVAIHPPFEIRQIEERGGYYKKALIYFYVDKGRAVKCYDLIK